LPSRIDPVTTGAAPLPRRWSRFRSHDVEPMTTYDPDARRDTPLARKLTERIRRHGPITVADYMHACLFDAEHGYYVSQPAIGGAGDFVTAPEISQVFGELIGLWCAVAWQSMGAPGRVRLVELGPGRGTLMRDALRAARLLPPFFAAIDVDLVETNRHLRGVQRATLADMGATIGWHDDLATVPAAPTIVIGNEFLDTFPVSQTMDHGPRRVGVDPGGRLVFEPAAGPIRERQDHAHLTHALAARAASSALAGLFLDYGHVETSAGDTLQAVRAHAAEHPLCSPGEADLTVQVDFAAFAAAARGHGFAVDGPVPQGAFLGRLGIVERASRLMGANPAKAGEIEFAVARLINPQGMGSRFKAIGIRSPALPPLPGLE
jgi:SAM-dependent MidA family methyltransferase